MNQEQATITRQNTATIELDGRGIESLRDIAEAAKRAYDERHLILTDSALELIEQITDALA